MRTRLLHSMLILFSSLVLSACGSKEEEKAVGKYVAALNTIVATKFAALTTKDANDFCTNATITDCSITCSGSTATIGCSKLAATCGTEYTFEPYPNDADPATFKGTLTVGSGGVIDIFWELIGDLLNIDINKIWVKLNLLTHLTPSGGGYTFSATANDRSRSELNLKSVEITPIVEAFPSTCN